MYTALGRLSCKNCNLNVSVGSDVKEIKAEEREQGSGNVVKEEAKETWCVDSGILSWCTVTCSGFYLQGFLFPPPSLQQVWAMSRSDWRETSGEAVDTQNFGFVPLSLQSVVHEH